MSPLRARVMNLQWPISCTQTRCTRGNRHVALRRPRLRVGRACGNKIPDRAARFSQSSLTPKPDVTTSLTPFCSDIIVAFHHFIRRSPPTAPARRFSTSGSASGNATAGCGSFRRKLAPSAPDQQWSAATQTADCSPPSVRPHAGRSSPGLNLSVCRLSF